MRTTLRFRNWETGESAVLDYEGRVEIKFDHLWLNGRRTMINIGYFSYAADRWLIMDEAGDEVGSFTDIIIEAMEAT